MSGKKLRGRRRGRHKLLIYKQRVVYFSCTYSEPISSTIKPSFRVRQQYPGVCWRCDTTETSSPGLTLGLGSGAASEMCEGTLSCTMRLWTPRDGVLAQRR